jgi:hypothetical protein
VTLAEAPQYLLRKLEREVLKNLSREKRELRKRVDGFDYFLFCFVAFSSIIKTLLDDGSRMTNDGESNE